MSKIDDAVRNVDEYFTGRFYQRPSMKKMLDSSKAESRARKAFNENFSALNEKMDLQAEAKGGLKDVTDRHNNMLETVQKTNSSKIDEINKKLKTYDRNKQTLSKIEETDKNMRAEREDAAKEVDEATKRVAEAEQKLNEAQSKKEIGIREEAKKKGPAAWIHKKIKGSSWEDELNDAEIEYANATAALSDARANQDRVQADYDQHTIEMNRLRSEIDAADKNGEIKALNTQREQLQQDNDHWRKIINDEYVNSVNKVLADYPGEAEKYLNLENVLNDAISQSNQAYEEFAEGYVTNGDYNNGCAAMTDEERSEVARQVTEIVKGRFNPDRGVAKDKPISLEEAKNKGDFTPQKFETNTYKVHVEKVEPGTECYNYLEDNEYTTDNDRCFIITGTAGEQWPINGDKLKSKYGIDPDSIDVGERIDASVNGGGNEIYAVKASNQVLIETAWGDTLMANRNGIPHGSGDMIVSTSPDFTGDVWVVNGEVFEGTYAPAGTAAAAAAQNGNKNDSNSKYNDMDGNEEHREGSEYSKEFTSKDGHRCRVSKSSGDMQVWVEGYTRIRKHKTEFVGSHWRTVGRAARTVS